MYNVSFIFRLVGYFSVVLLLNKELEKVKYCTTENHIHVYVFVISTLRLKGGAVASWLVRSTLERMVRFQVLAGDIVLCSWAGHFTLTVPLSTQVYKWVPANLMLRGNPAID